MIQRDFGGTDLHTARRKPSGSLERLQITFVIYQDLSTVRSKRIVRPIYATCYLPEPIQLLFIGR
jgi:hypothetical protein